MAVTKAQNSVVADPIMTAMQAITEGKDAAEAVYGPGVVGFDKLDDGPSPEAKPNPLDNIEETEETSENETSANKSANQEETTETPTAEMVTEISSTPTGIEEVFVRNVDGKRQAVKIDYENKEAVKRAYLKAAGFDLINKKLGSRSKEFTTLEKTYKSLKSDMDKLEDIYQNKGVEALIQVLGKSDELNKLVDAKIKQQEYLRSLSPEEKYRHEMKQQNEAAEKRVTDTEAKYQKMLDEISKKDEQANTRSLESRLHPSFDRYRFAGKLGDPVAEHRLDKTIWNEVTERLADYPEEVELTQALVDKEFRTVAQELQKVITVQTEKNVQKTVDKKKAEAAKTVQLTAKKGLAAGGEKDKFVNSIKSGDIMGAMTAMMSGKLKL